MKIQEWVKKAYLFTIKRIKIRRNLSTSLHDVCLSQSLPFYANMITKNCHKICLQRGFQQHSISSFLISLPTIQQHGDFWGLLKVGRILLQGLVHFWGVNYKFLRLLSAAPGIHTMPGNQKQNPKAWLHISKGHKQHFTSRKMTFYLVWLRVNTISLL